jgi:hypothetical protein
MGSLFIPEPGVTCASSVRDDTKQPAVYPYGRWAISDGGVSFHRSNVACGNIKPCGCLVSIGVSPASVEARMAYVWRTAILQDLCRRCLHPVVIMDFLCLISRGLRSDRWKVP